MMKKLLAALFVCLSAASAWAGVKIEHWIAPSGARVYFVETHALPILDVEVNFTAGTAYDAADKAGVAGLTRGLLDAGAGGLDEEKIAGRLVDIGARLSGTTDHDRAGLNLRTLSSKAEKESALDLMRVLLAQPAFPEAVLAREKARLISAIQEADTRPDSIAAKRFARAMYPDHPYGLHSTVESVGRITRDDLASFHRDHYSARRAVVSLIGDVTRAEAERIAQQLTEALPAGKADGDLPAVRMPSKGTHKVAHPAAQSHIHIGLPAIRRTDPDYYALLVGNYTLGGGGFVSRLMKEVREKRGYAYSVHSYFAPRRFEGPFQIGLQTKREQAGDALKVAGEVLAGFMKDGPTEKELAAAKKNLINGQALRIDSNAKLIGYLSAIGFYGLPLTYLDDFPAKVGAVTAKDVREAFARHVKPSSLVTVVVASD
ncbi:MAG: insulinase family protein [Candidatus Nitricoxidivorans perseverans]|uniref:Insulinase family protein n=1 Tax=Candidatus Nitricoxidivorans perseverans TaxID=2975601 RepID=A0AA49FJJ7_9PROT|nr:MAG: insulinase family protein [Candidatus Nitricoxidivorans perseverans]